MTAGLDAEEMDALAVCLLDLMPKKGSRWSLRLDGWQVFSTRQYCSRQPYLRGAHESLGETTVLMNRQHSSQQKFFDLFGELKCWAIFLFAMDVMYHDHFSFRNERDVRFDCPFLSVGIPADFLNWLGYQLVFLIRWDCPFLPVGIPSGFLYWLGYQLIFFSFGYPLIFLICWDTSWFC